MSDIFEYTDLAGDRVQVYTDGESAFVRTRTTGEDVAVHIPAEKVAALRAALASIAEAPAETGNPAAILDYVDPDGDSLTVYTRTNPAEPLALVATCGEGTGSQAVHLTPACVTRLREALKPHDPAEMDKPAPVDPLEIEVGREYRLLPGAHCSGNDAPEECFRNVTRVRVEMVDAGDGDARVTVLDGGTYAGSEGWYVLRRFLAPLTDPSDAAIAALRARLTATPAETAPKLDPLRLAALEKARELAPESNGSGLAAMAAFLLGEAL